MLKTRWPRTKTIAAKRRGYVEVKPIYLGETLRLALP
jgi:hypothetical protein